MVAVVNTNVMSLNAQRQLNKSQSTQNQAMERLSSGLRINSAKDDAAGLAISTGMQSQINGMNQAVRNANDGVSMAQTAEGSMDEMTNILQRMRELSVQSANDTNSSENRASIQKEVDQLSAELDRIAENTEFNGTKLLNGSAGETTLQVGANSGQTISFSIDSVTTNALGLNGNLNKGDINSGRIDVTGITNAGDVVINGTDIGAVTADTGNTAGAIVKAINAKTSDTGVTASAYNVVQGDHASSTVTGVTSALSIKSGKDDAVVLGATSSMTNLVDTINRDVSGVTASLGDNGELLLTNDTGEDITIAGTVTGSGLTAGVNTGYLALDNADDSPIAITGTSTSDAGFLASNGASSVTTVAVATTTTGGILESDAITINGAELKVALGTAGTATQNGDAIRDAVNALTSETGVTASNAAGVLTLTSADGSPIEVSSDAATKAARTTALGLLGMQSEMGGKVIGSLGTNVSTAAGASSTIDKIDSALAQLSESRAGLGATQNRLSSTISNLENVSQNLSASNSRIQDADFAAETSKMSKAQILQQAGTSMLSQANASAQSVLSLLG